MTQPTYKPGDVVQISRDYNPFNNCFMTVIREQEDFVQGFIVCPQPGTGNPEPRYCLLNAPREVISYVGITRQMPEAARDPLPPGPQGAA